MVLVAFLLGVAVRACWLMFFPLPFLMGPGVQELTLAELTFKTLMSLLWSGGVAALAAAVVLVFRGKILRRPSRAAEQNDLKSQT